MYRGYVGTFFSHCLSLLSSVWAIISLANCGLTYTESLWMRLAFFLMTANSCLAMVRYGNSDFGYKLRKLHIFTLNLSTIISYSIIEFVQLYIYNLPKCLLYTPLLNVFTVVYNLLQKDYRTKIKLCDSFIALNMVILCVASFLKENYFSVALSISYLFGYFIVGESGFLFDTELPSIDAFQYLTCFFNIFTVYAISY